MAPMSQRGLCGAGLIPFSVDFETWLAETFSAIDRDNLIIPIWMI